MCFSYVNTDLICLLYPCAHITFNIKSIISDSQNNMLSYIIIQFKSIINI